MQKALNFVVNQRKQQIDICDNIFYFPSIVSGEKSNSSCSWQQQQVERFLETYKIKHDIHISGDSCEPLKT